MKKNLIGSLMVLGIALSQPALALDCREVANDVYKITRSLLYNGEVGRGVKVRLGSKSAALDDVLAPEIARAASGALGYALEQPKCSELRLYAIHSSARTLCLAVSNTLWVGDATFNSQEGKDLFIAFFQEMDSKYECALPLERLNSAAVR